MQLDLNIPDMTCGRCAAHVTRAIADLDPEARLQLALPARRVRIDTTVSEEEVRACLLDAGYPAS